jgi:hypothetical protein
MQARERKWFVLDAVPSDESVPVFEEPSGWAVSVPLAAPYLQQPVVEVERVRGDCCGCCACFARCCDGSEESRNKRDSPSMYNRRCISGGCVLLLIVVGVVLFATLVASLDGYGDVVDSGSGSVLADQWEDGSG